MAEVGWNPAMKSSASFAVAPLSDESSDGGHVEASRIAVAM